jgi:hypothetical protein
MGDRLRLSRLNARNEDAAGGRICLMEMNSRSLARRATGRIAVMRIALPLFGIMFPVPGWGIAHLPFSFWRPDHHVPSELGQVFVAELPEWELVAAIHDAAWAIMWDWANRSQQNAWHPVGVGT